MNETILIGRLTKDLELRKTTNGISTCSFTLAVKRNYKNLNGEYESDFINCIAYKQPSEYMCKYCKKGDLLAVKGRIQTGSYTAQDGSKRYTTDVIAEKITFMSVPKKESDNSNTVQPIQEQKQENDPFKEFANEVVITDNDLPF